MSCQLNILILDFKYNISLRIPFLYKLHTHAMLQIRDGSDSASALLNQLTGTTVPQYILSSSTATLLIFSSDGANVLDGYNVTWEAKLRM